MVVIAVSDENYNVLESMRKQKPGKKAFESFNDVISRVLAGEKKNE